MNWSLPLFYQAGHLSIPPPSGNQLLTIVELIELYRQFIHPSDGKLYSLLKSAYAQQINEKITQMTQDITDNCEHCFEHSVPPFKLGASVPMEEVLFNREVSIDLMCLNGKPVLHVVDTDTGFLNGVIIKYKTTEGLWTIFLNCWTSVCIGFP